MSSTRSLAAVSAAIATAVVLLVVVPGASADPKPEAAARSNVDVQVLAINDFHGNLQPPAGSSGRVGTVNAGGAEYLATHIANLEAGHPNSIVVSAGDLIGASPLVSAIFHDEPTIEAMNEIGLDLNAVGNHEFDEGVAELQRMQYGGCHPTDGCLDGTPFDGADFQFLAANVVNETTGNTAFPPYSIQNLHGARVAFIGMTLEGTPTIVSAAGIAGWQFRDEADTVNELVPQLRRRGVEAIVVLVHEGGVPTALDYNGCAGVSGPIVDIVSRLDPAVDLVVSGHTHQPYNCVIDGIPTTSAYSFGRLVTDIDMTVSRRTGDVVSLTVNNRVVTRDVPLSAKITALINRYSEIAAPIANRPIGNITADILRAADSAGQSSLGLLIADAQLAATDTADTGGAVVAFMNSGGVRADLLFGSSGAGEGDGVVTYGEAFTVQPFGNILQTITMTGAQIEQVLEQQFCGVNSPLVGGFFRILQPSAGFSYMWNAAGTGGDPTSTPPGACPTLAAAGAVDPASITLNGVPLDPSAPYRVTVSNFLADGGDGYPAFTLGTDRTGGGQDLDAFEAYFGGPAAPPLSPPAQNRIVRVG